MRRVALILIALILVSCTENDIAEEVNDNIVSNITNDQTEKEIDNNVRNTTKEEIQSENDGNINEKEEDIENEHSEKYVYIDVDVLNIRSNPTVKSKILSKLSKFEEVLVYEVEYDHDNKPWYRILFDNDKTGWIAGWYTSEIKDYSDEKLNHDFPFSVVRYKDSFYCSGPYNFYELKIKKTDVTVREVGIFGAFRTSIYGDYIYYFEMQGVSEGTPYRLSIPHNLYNQQEILEYDAGEYLENDYMINNYGFQNGYVFYGVSDSNDSIVVYKMELSNNSANEILTDTEVIDLQISSDELFALELNNDKYSLVRYNSQLDKIEKMYETKNKILNYYYYMNKYLILCEEGEPFRFINTESGETTIISGNTFVQRFNVLESKIIFNENDDEYYDYESPLNTKYYEILTGETTELNKRFNNLLSSGGYLIAHEFYRDDMDPGLDGHSSSELTIFNSEMDIIFQNSFR